jgi:biotin carboxyl carrier protein
MEKKFRITVEGRQYIVTVEELSEGGSLLFPEPGSMDVPPPAAMRPAAVEPRALAAGPGDEVSPLAGVVQTVDVTLDQVVNEGDKIASLDAMKMTTTVFAHRSGKVTHIAVKPGDAVDAGQTLLTIA